MAKMINKKRIAIAIVLIWICTIYLPGFDGVVLDDKTGKPVSNATIICFTSIYPGFSYLLGHGNDTPDKMSISKSDDSGHFSVGTYLRLWPGVMETRKIYIYKRDYYALRYYQDNKYILYDSRIYDSIQDIRSDTRVKKRLTPFTTITFRLKKESSEYNEIAGALFDASFYWSHFSDRLFDKNQKPDFVQFYNLMKADEDFILESSRVNENVVRNFKFELESFKRDLRL